MTAGIWTMIGGMLTATFAAALLRTDSLSPPQQQQQQHQLLTKIDQNNRSCPENCTCSHQISSAPNFDTLAPKQIVDCDSIDVDRLKQLFVIMPSGVTSLALRRTGLTNLAAICCMDNLESLDVSNNLISDLIVYYEFDRLTFLNLQNNALRILRKEEFTSFPNLETLNVDSNEITSIDQDSFRLMSLQKLYLSQNNISYVNERVFRYAANLELLDLSGNRLTSLHSRNFYYSRKLRKLDLSNNQLTSIDADAFEPLHKLEELNLAANNLTQVNALALQRLPALRTLTFDLNPLTVLENGTLCLLNELEQARFDQLSELSMVLEDAFYDMPKLRTLSICSCQRLSYLSPRAFGRNLQSLRELYLTNNALTHLPAPVLQLAANQLLKFDPAGNPLNCECLRRTVARRLGGRRPDGLRPDAPCRTNDNRLSGLNVTSSDAQCLPRLTPSSNASLVRPIGSRLQLYCAVTGGGGGDDAAGDVARVRWIIPDGRNLSRERVPRLDAGNERLLISFLSQNDTGRYVCSSDGAHVRYVDLKVDAMSAVIVPIEVSAYYVTWSWGTARGKDSRPVADCQLMFKGEQDSEFACLDLPAFWERYTVHRLKPDTNYSFCLVYSRERMTLYDYCIFVRTEKAYVHFGVSLNYSMIALVAVSVSLICALCVARCVHKRLHIWQEEKYRGRMQESLSAQGFLSSFESLNGGNNGAAVAAVTYENRNALDASVASPSSTIQTHPQPLHHHHHHHQHHQQQHQQQQHQQQQHQQQQHYQQNYHYQRRQESETALDEIVVEPPERNRRRPSAHLA